MSRNESSSRGGGVYSSNGGSLTVNDGTILVSNSAAEGGGIYNSASTGVVENCTLSRNSSALGTGGGVANIGSGNLILRHCTIADNVGAGVLNNAPAALALDNTIVAGNFNVNNAAFDLQGDYTAIGANLLRVHSGTRLGGPAPLTGDPLLGALTAGVMNPLVGSPVINAGVATTNTPSTDQEHSFRPFGPAPDLGSIESKLSGEVDLFWLTTSAGTLEPAFERSRTDYSVSVPDSTTTAAVRAATVNGGQTIDVRINDGAFSTIGTKEASANLPLNPGDNSIEVKVTAQNGTTTRIYRIVVIRGAPPSANKGLATLTSSSGPLSPVFESAVTSYHTIVPNNTTSTTVTALAAKRVRPSK